MIMPMKLFPICHVMVIHLLHDFYSCTLRFSCFLLFFFSPFFSSADFRLKFNGFQTFTSLIIMRVRVDVALARCQYV